MEYSKQTADRSSKSNRQVLYKLWHDDAMPTSRSAQTQSAGTYMNFEYNFNATTGNLNYRKDVTRNITENFSYDNLNRLTGFGGQTVTYDPKGNITQKSGIGNYHYLNNAKPYALTGIVQSGDVIPERQQQISYASFSRPLTITEYGYSAQFIYEAGSDRVKMLVTKNGVDELTRYYLANQYELDEKPGSAREKLYLGGDYYSAGAVLVKDNGGAWQVYYINSDYLGSMTHVVNSAGVVVAEYSYDAWGRLRNPVTHAIYADGQQPELFLGRGYTGHEHLNWFGLINMNARLYDPVHGRFLAPDPYVQAPDFTQSFNRYSYAWGNPLRYTDKDGEFLFVPVLVGMAWGALIGAATSAAIYTVQVAVTGQKWDIKNFGQAVGMGALGGALGGGLGAIGSQIGSFGQTLGYNILSNVASNSATTMAFGGELSWSGLAGMVAGGIAGAKIGGFNGVKGSTLKNIGAEMAFGIGKGALTGAVGGAVDAGLSGTEFGEKITRGLVNGAIAGGTTSGLNIAIMGATIVPEGIEDRFKQDDAAYGIKKNSLPVYRRGGITKLFTSGITLGRNLIIDSRGGNSRQFRDDLAHERAHYYQQFTMGFANFYGRIFKEYFISPGYSSQLYYDPQYLDYWAEQYRLLTP